MKLFKKIMLIAALSLSVSTITPSAVSNPSFTVEAHSGRTDSNGGHHDNKNKSGLGSYHYHCGGYPAHLHENGVCPYTGSGNTAVSTTSAAAGSSDSSENITASSSGSSSTVSISGKSLTLSSGDSVAISKDIIKIVQDVLNQKGYECGKADGVIGKKTKEALENFLNDNESDSASEADSDYLIIKMIAEALDIQ